MAVDLHIHTTASDGTNTPMEVVRMAKEMGLKAIAITDHDTVEGVTPALAEGRKIGLEVIPGIEINTEVNGKEIHVLGYYVDFDDPVFSKNIEKLRGARLDRINKIIEKLRELGININIDRVLKIAGPGAIGRPHVALALKEMGVIFDIREAFDKYIGLGRPAYVPRYKLSPHDAVEIISQAGGIPVLAHPGLVGDDDLIYELLNHGLKGLEAYHSDHTREQINYYLKKARELDLIVTGGSDFHGFNLKLHCNLGGVDVPDEVLDDLKALYEGNV